MKRFALLSLLLVGCMSTEQLIALDEVPRVVMEAAYTEVPDLQVTKVTFEDSREGRIYEVEGTASGFEFELEISETGQVLNVESKAID